MFAWRIDLHTGWQKSAQFCKLYNFIKKLTNFQTFFTVRIRKNGKNAITKDPTTS